MLVSYTGGPIDEDYYTRFLQSNYGQKIGEPAYHTTQRKVHVPILTIGNCNYQA